MNIKLHTPKSLKTGSGMATMKQFLLSIVATSISIALTFGTAAILDYNKKQKEKREIVMMVMYDMYNSLKSIQKADSTIQQAMDMQLQIAEDFSRFDALRYNLAGQMMDVSDADIDTYREQRKQIDKRMIGDDASGDSLVNRFLQIQETIEEAKAKLQ